MPPLAILKTDYLPLYRLQQRYTLDKHTKKLTERTLNFDDFRFYLTAAAVYSSQIEGNHIDLDSYMKYNESGMNTQGKSFLEIKDLIDAYQFAAKNTLTAQNVLAAHALLSARFLDEIWRGNIRTEAVGIFAEGKKIYTAAPANIVATEFEKLLADTAFLIQQPLTTDQIFYYAAQIHLRLAQIHPFADGNGRMARLVEKWFLAAFLGEKAYTIASEKYYFTHRKLYYTHIHLGSHYHELDYTHCLPFLLLLPRALRLC